MKIISRVIACSWWMTVATINELFDSFLKKPVRWWISLKMVARPWIGSIAAKQNYDLILMDVQMPIMDGYEATEQLRKMGFESPIIAVTAYALSRDLKRALAVGCDDFVTKPLVPAQLIRKVERWLCVPGRTREEGSES